MALTKVTYAMIEGDPANVLDFGAIGDGVADDTVAIQAAIDSGNKNVFFPDGTYKTTTTLTIDSPEITLFGGTATINFLPATGVAFLTNSATNNSITLRSLKFNGNFASRTVNRATLFGDIDLSDAANITIQSCEFINMAAGSFVRSYVPGSATSSVFRIENNVFTGGKEATATADDNTTYLALRYASSPPDNMSWFITNNVFNGIVPVTTNYGIGGISITGESADPDADTGPKATINGNVFYNVGFDTPAGNRIGGIVAYRVAPYSVVTNNRILTCYERGIDIQGSVAVTVSNNILEDIASSGITYFSRDTSPLKNSSQGLISNNTIIDARFAFDIDGSSSSGNAYEDILIDGNIVKNCFAVLSCNKLSGGLVVSNNLCETITSTSTDVDQQAFGIFADRANLAATIDLAVVFSNNILKNSTCAIYITGVKSINFEGNTLDTVTTSIASPFVVTTFAEKLVFSNNELNDGQRFLLSNASSAVISNNIFETASGIRCVQFNGGDYTNVSGNIFRSCPNDVINYQTLGASSRNVLHGNVFDSGATIRNATVETITYLAATFGDGNLA